MCFLCTQANASIAIKVIPYKSHGELFYKTCGVAHKTYGVTHMVHLVLFMIQHCTEALTCSTLARLTCAHQHTACAILIKSDSA